MGRGRPWQLILAVLLVYSFQSAYSDLISDIAYVRVVTDGQTGITTRQDARKLTFSCSDADFEFEVAVYNPQTNVTVWYIVNCQPPTILFDATAFQYVPQEIKVAGAFVCTSATPSTALAANRSAEATVITAPGGRRLLELISDFIEAGIIDLIPGGKDAIQSVSCSVGVAGNCDGGLNGVIPDWVNQLDTLKAQLLASKPWNADILAVENTFQDANLEMNGTLIALAKAVQGLSDIANTTANGLNELGKKVTQQAADSDAEKIILANQIDAVAALSTSYSDANTKQVNDNLAVVADTLLSTIKNDSAVLYNNIKYLGTRIDQTVKLVRQVENNILVGVSGQNIAVTDALKRLLIAKLAIFESASFHRFVDPLQPGVDPRTPTPEDITVAVDIDTVNFVNVSLVGGSHTVAHQFGITLKCNIATLFKAVPLGAQWRDFLTMIGPVGCVANATSNNVPLSSYCTCWVEITHKFCTASNAFNWQQITTLSDRSAYQMTAANPCQNVAPTADSAGWDGRMFDDVLLWHNFLGRMSVSSLSVNTQFQIVSTRSGVVNIDPSLNRFVTTVDLASIFDGSATEYGVPGTIYHHWTLAFPEMQADFQAYRNTGGILPNWVTTVVFPYMQIGTGEASTCYLSGISTISDATEIVYKLKPGLPQNHITVTSWDQAPICDINGCTSQGNLLGTISTSSVDSVNIPAQAFLPRPESIVFGELTSGMVSMYDISEDDTSGAAYDRARIHTHNYLGWNLPTGYVVANTVNNPLSATLRQWMIENGLDPFDHFGVASLHEALRTISNGQCTVSANPLITDNHLCQLLNNFIVHPSSNMRQGHITFEPIVYSYTATIDSVLGTVEERVGVGCPDFTFNAGVTGKSLQVTNSLPISITCVVRQTVSDVSCPDISDRTLVLQPKQTWAVALTTCGNLTAQVFRALSGDVSMLLPCADAIATTVEPQYQSSLEPVLNITTATVIDISFESATAIGQLVNDLLSDWIGLIAPIIDPTFSFNITSDLNATLTRFQFQLFNAVNSVNFLADAAGAENLGDGITAVLNSVVNPQLAIANAHIANLQADLLTANAELNKSRSDLAILQNATDAAVVAIDVLKADLLAIQNSKSSSSCSNKSPPIIGPLLCYVLDFLITVLYVGIAVGIVYAIYRIYLCFKASSDASKAEQARRKVSGRYAYTPAYATVSDMDIYGTVDPVNGDGVYRI